MRSTRFLVWAALFVTLSALPPAARAAWQHSPLGPHLAVCNAVDYQINAVSAPDDAGGMFVVWEDRRFGGADLYGQHISAAGVPLWAANGIPICTGIGAHTPPAVTADGAGGVVIVWADTRAGSSTDLYAQRVNGAGSALWTANGLAITTATGVQDQAVIVGNGEGGAIIAWHDTRNGNDDVYCQMVLSSGFIAWVAGGIPACAATGSQLYPSMSADGEGGAYITWMDTRSGNYDVYAQRMGSNGARAWAVNGIAVRAGSGDQTYPRIVSDGSNGALLTWMDGPTGIGTPPRVQSLGPTGTLRWGATGVVASATAGNWYPPVLAPDGAGGCFLAWSGYAIGVPEEQVRVQHVNALGSTQWGVDGIRPNSASWNQYLPEIIPDGGGGAIVAFCDSRPVGAGQYAQRIAWNGAVTWTANGSAVSMYPDVANRPLLLPDGAGGALMTWIDARSNGDQNIYAQRLDRYGMLGNADPTITEVRDVAHDQGGRLKLSWTASYPDADPLYGITDYRVWRSVPTRLALASGAPRRETTTDADEAVATGRLLVEPNASLDYAWEYVATSPAATLPSYSMVVDTEGDSTGTGNPRTAYRVEARANTSISSPHWFSAPDSGYSVDNLAPAAPAPLTGQYGSGSTQLHWNRNTEADLAGYRLYRGNNAAFVPGPANFIAQLPDTGAVDAAGAPYVYKLTAVDIHGNESPVATLIPSGTLGVNDAPRALAFAAPSPNPARGATTLRYSLSTRGAVKLALFDAAGRRVATLADGVMEAGEHSVAFALRDDAGRDLPAGLYLARLDAEGRTLTRRIAAVR